MNTHNILMQDLSYIKLPYNLHQMMGLVLEVSCKGLSVIGVNYYRGLIKRGYEILLQPFDLHESFSPMTLIIMYACLPLFLKVNRMQLHPCTTPPLN